MLASEELPAPRLARDLSRFRRFFSRAVEDICCSSLSCKITYLLIKGRQRSIDEAFSGAEPKCRND